jgi:hypothetical protein
LPHIAPYCPILRLIAPYCALLLHYAHLTRHFLK